MVLAGLKVLLIEDEGLVEGAVQDQVGLGGGVRSHHPRPSPILLSGHVQVELTLLKVGRLSIT